MPEARRLLAVGLAAPGMVYATDPSADPSPTAPADPSPTPDPTATPTLDPTPTPDATPTPDLSPTPTPASTPAPDPTATPTPDPTPTPVPTVEPTLSYIVAFTPASSGADRAAALAAAGATPGEAIAPLNLQSITFPSSTAAAGLATLLADPSVVRVDADAVRDAGAAPSDPEYANQWSLPKIGWDQAFGTVSPVGTATVAILDTGVDASHPDLGGQLVAGTSVLDGSAGTTDPNGHGTWMAGIVAAATDNGLGVAGVGYAGVRVMPVTVLGADGTGQDSDIIAGVVYAADHGADVILMSFSNPGFSASLQAAIDYAWNHGVVLVAATGNDATSSPTFPAGDRGVIGVSNTDQNDALNASSNYGADTFLAAPGTDIETTNSGGAYATITGTSASAAEVAASAALVAANDAGATNGVIVNRLGSTADPAGTTDQTGNGRLNLGRALVDTSTVSVQPAGAAPVGDGGPYVGPYVTATLAATASVDVKSSWRNTTGNVQTFTVNNTSTASETLQAVLVQRPGAEWTITGCSVGAGTPALSTATLATVASQNACQFRVGDTGATGNQAAGTSASWFQVTSTSNAGATTVSAAWVVTVDRDSDTVSGGNQAAATASSAGALTTTTFVWEVTNASAETSAATIGGACPGPTITAPASANRVLVICGRNRGNATLTPLGANSSLAGTFIGTAGTLSSSGVPGNMTGASTPVVLANYTNTFIDSSAGAGKTVISTIGSAANAASPSTLLSGYTITANATPAAPTNLDQFQADGTTSIPVGGTNTDGTMVFKGDVSDTDANQVRLEVEVKAINGPFTGTGTITGSLVASGATASASGALANLSYHWRARTVDSNGAVSSWVSFGGNVDDSDTDFIVAAGPKVTAFDLQAGSDTGFGTSDRITNLSTLNYTLTFNQAVTGLSETDPDFTVTGSATGCVVGTPTGGPTSYTIPLTLCGPGTVILTLAANAVTGGDLTTGPTPDPVPAPTVTIDQTGPTATLTLQAGSDTGISGDNITNAATLTWDVSFNEAVYNLAAGDFAFQGGANGCVVGAPSGSAPPTASYTVALTSCSNGTTTTWRLSGGGVNDVAGNAGPPANVVQTFTIDRTAPGILSINRAALAQNPTNALSVDFTITFSEDVVGVTTCSCLSLTTSGGISGAGVGTISGTSPGPTRNVAVNTGSGDGTIRLDLASTTNITDRAGNALAAGRNGDQTYTIDKTLASVSTFALQATSDTGASNSDGITNAANLVYTLTFTRRSPASLPATSPLPVLPRAARLAWLARSRATRSPSPCAPRARSTSS